MSTPRSCGGADSPGLVFWLLLAVCTALGPLGILQGWVAV